MSAIERKHQILTDEKEWQENFDKHYAGLSLALPKAVYAEVWARANSLQMDAAEWIEKAIAEKLGRLAPQELKSTADDLSRCVFQAQRLSASRS